MRSHATLDRESFERFLANASAVQNSAWNRQLLSALVEVQHFIAKDEFTVDQVLDLIADRTRKVSNASGIAVALLEGNQLVYRAGSGTAATDVGRHVPAVLSVCTPSKAGVEILRVENAQTDSRIEAEICRQFGATSLLILPIYRAQAVAGVLQVHFIDAHKFLDEEVRTYRLMSGLVEEAMLRNVQRGSKDLAKESVTVAPVIRQNTPQEQTASGYDNSFAAAGVEPGQPFGEHVTAESTTFTNRASTPGQWNLYRLSIVKLWPIGATVTAAVLAFAILVGHGHHPAPTMTESALPRPADTRVGILPEPLSLRPKSGKSANGMKDEIAPSPAFRRVRIAPNEVDYVAEDVTIRNFTNTPARHQPRTYFKEVNIGQDVTVRYFAHKAALSQAAPAQLSTQTSEHALPASQ
jgi:GAF domain